MIFNRRQVNREIPAMHSNRYGIQRAQQLLTLLADIRSRDAQWLRAMRDRDSPDFSTSGDEGDSATSGETFELAASLAELASTRVAAVESALQRLREGRYGVCEECGEEIPFERLKALPTTMLCVDCQREREAASPRGRNDTPTLWVMAKDRPPLVTQEELIGRQADENGAHISKRKRGRPASPRQ
jgi:RNA polymerase-binding protein DksA